MGIDFTDEQKKVIELRDRNILVSAAAGSGKTAVLVERIITRLTKDKEPLHVDELLIVTFTEAAAAEMKERIRMAIDEALEADPGNVHLQKQATLINQAQITTIHSFCLSVIRNYFHRIDMEPGFRTGEEGELKLLQHDVLEEVLEEFYAAGEESFLNFVESFASGKDDRQLENLILQIYKFSRSHPNPKKWIHSCIENYQVASVEELEEQDYVKSVLQEIQELLSDIVKKMEYSREICLAERGPKEYLPMWESDWEQIERVREAKSLREVENSLKSIGWMTLSRKVDKSVDEALKDQYKALRSEVKDIFQKVKEQYFMQSLESWQKGMLAAKENMQVLTRLVNTFADAFAEKKKSKNMIDFSDMEQYALQILTTEQDGVYVPTAAAKEYQQQFKEVMIDEYQDSNLVQETILTSVSGMSQGKYNMFMVGDVKQSIYRFRLSRPDLFMEKFDSYSLDESKTQRIDLHRNFRSRKEVLGSVNFVFEQIMQKKFGGIEYDNKAALHVGATYTSKQGNETEILLIDAAGTSSGERIEYEAGLIAQRVKELRANYTVVDKKTKEERKVNYSDIVILARGLKGWTEVFAEVFRQEGIPFYTNSREGYFETREVKLILDYLKILDNPRQDIPFVAVLASMFAGINEEELAEIKSEASGKSFYEKSKAYAETSPDSLLGKKLNTFFEQYQTFRDAVPYTAIHTLLGRILTETGYENYMEALSGGEQRKANLEMLLQKAVTFEGTSYKGLFNFVRYIEELQKYDVDYGEASITDEHMDAVCMMTIHKSKGLEFPIAFVAGIGKTFNLMDTNGDVVIHPELGIGIDVVDVGKRTKKPSFLKKVIQRQLIMESKAEELRVLYVAMTRAKEKLILVGGSRNIEGFMKTCTPLRKEYGLPLQYSLITKASRYMDWIVYALWRNKCFENIRCEYDSSSMGKNPLEKIDVPIIVKKVTPEQIAMEIYEDIVREEYTKEALLCWNTEYTYNDAVKEQMKTQFEYQYPDENLQKMKQKLSVSELKKKAYQDEDGEEIFPEETVMPLYPKFMREEEVLSGASRGTAYHRFLELLDFTPNYDEKRLGEILEDYVEKHLMEPDMAKCIRLKDIQEFLTSGIGKRVQYAEKAGLLHKEQPFVLGIPASGVYPEKTEETLLVQGIIDAYFEEDGELIVLDYKTDKVFRAEELAERYHAQLDYYASALERLTGKRVKEKIIYSFTLQKEIEV